MSTHDLPYIPNAPTAEQSVLEDIALGIRMKGDYHAIEAIDMIGFLPDHATRLAELKRLIERLRGEQRTANDQGER